MYDLIGDIHGYADELVQLLETLGYQKAHGVYRHPDRKVIFIRTRRYLSPNGQKYRTYALQSSEITCDLGLDETVIAAAASYSVDTKPVFVGHYRLSVQRPELLADNVSCLDYGVAKGGFLCAYRWNGEQKLSNDNFVWAQGG